MDNPWDIFFGSAPIKISFFQKYIIVSMHALKSALR